MTDLVPGLTTWPANQRPRIYDPERGEQPSEELAQCAHCGRTGWMSDWPGVGAICRGTSNGTPYCDACAAELGEDG